MNSLLEFGIGFFGGLLLTFLLYFVIAFVAGNLGPNWPFSKNGSVSWQNKQAEKAKIAAAMAARNKPAIDIPKLPEGEDPVWWLKEIVMPLLSTEDQLQVVKEMESPEFDLKRSKWLNGNKEPYKFPASPPVVPIHTSTATHKVISIFNSAGLQTNCVIPMSDALAQSGNNDLIIKRVLAYNPGFVGKQIQVYLNGNRIATNNSTQQVIDKFNKTEWLADLQDHLDSSLPKKTIRYHATLSNPTDSKKYSIEVQLYVTEISNISGLSRVVDNIIKPIMVKHEKYGRWTLRCNAFSANSSYFVYVEKPSEHNWLENLQLELDMKAPINSQIYTARLISPAGKIHELDIRLPRHEVGSSAGLQRIMGSIVGPALQNNKLASFYDIGQWRLEYDFDPTKKIKEKSANEMFEDMQAKFEGHEREMDESFARWSKEKSPVRSSVPAFNPRKYW